jgi:hypothetical protein
VAFDLNQVLVYNYSKYLFYSYATEKNNGGFIMVISSKECCLYSCFRLVFHIRYPMQQLEEQGQDEQNVQQPELQMQLEKQK